MPQLTYKPEIFDAPDLEAAKRIIATPTPTLDTETRWRRETPYLAGLIGERLALGPGRMVIDYGCGVGRIAKAVLQQFGCRVLGVDISARMRSLAPEYVDSPWFSAVSRGVLRGMVDCGFRADAAFPAWVLQHSVRPAEDVALLAASLKPGAPVLVVNAHERLVPTVEKTWAGDSEDVASLMAAAFDVGEEIALDPGALGAEVVAASWCRVYRAR